MKEPSVLAPEPAASARPPKALRRAPCPEPITDPSIIRARYAHERPRILVWTTAGYGIFYFVRKNLSVAMPLIEKQFGFSKESLGLILTSHQLVYGVSKFVSGVMADRASARLFMAGALLASAVLNVLFGLSSALYFFGLFWVLNGWVQGMGYPPCARLLSHWFAPRELATKMSFWNASHSLGGGAILILCGWLVTRFGDWRLCFYVPAGIAAVMSLLLFVNLRDTPESIGLPELEGTHVEQATSRGGGEFRSFLWRRVFSDKYIWIVSAANFFVYTIRFAVFDWGPTLLKEFKGVNIGGASGMVAGFEFAGLGGMLLTGWLTDRYCAGRAAPIAMISMILCGLCVLLFWIVPPHHVVVDTTLLAGIGFFVYGPQALVAVIVVNLATKKAAATAVGLTSIFGYASTVLTGWGFGRIAKNYGWSPVFVILMGIAVVGALLFAAALPARANGYGEQSLDTAESNDSGRDEEENQL